MPDDATQWLLAPLLVVALTAFAGCSAVVHGRAHRPPASAAAVPGPTPTTPPPRSVAPPPAPRPHIEKPGPATAARTLVGWLVRDLPRGSVSVAALDTVTGASFAAGARGGIWTASVVKVDILETLLLRAEDAGVGLSAEEQLAATLMIEHSDNERAEELFWAAGGRDGIIAANARLGLGHTVVGPEDYWGLTTTSAADQITLLRHLVTPGLLPAPARRYVRGLMSNVAYDQRWGVSVAGDRGSPVITKDGWLSIVEDGDRWAVGSVGLVTVGGHLLLMAVLTQHNPSMEDGVELVQRLARLTATAVRDRR